MLWSIVYILFRSVVNSTVIHNSLRVIFHTFHRGTTRNVSPNIDIVIPSRWNTLGTFTPLYKLPRPSFGSSTHLRKDQQPPGRTCLFTIQHISSHYLHLTAHPHPTRHHTTRGQSTTHLSFEISTGRHCSTATIYLPYGNTTREQYILVPKRNSLPSSLLPLHLSLNLTTTSQPTCAPLLESSLLP